jgi:hypothetical protein
MTPPWKISMPWTQLPDAQRATLPLLNPEIRFHRGRPARNPWEQGEIFPLCHVKSLLVSPRSASIIY